MWRAAGFTIIELLVSVFILSILAGVALPMVEVVHQRGKEEQLRVALRDLREAIDAYKKASDQGHILKSIGQSGYPPNLKILVDGVQDAASPKRERIFFLRRVPRDPFASDPSVPAEVGWGKRSYASSADDPQEGADVFDVYSRSEGVGLNGVPYRDW